MRSIVCHTEDPDELDAAAELIRKAQCELNGETPKGAMLFMSVEYDHNQVLQALREAWPGLPLIGGTTDGEISSDLGFARDSIALTLFVGDDIEVRAGTASDLAADPEAAVARCVADAGAEQAKVCITVIAPSANSTDVVRLLDDAIDREDCPVVGGLTGDHREFARTREFFGDRVQADSITALFIEGDIQVSWGVGSGWFPLGEPECVTASEGHMVSAIASRPALEFYHDHWGVLPTGSLGEYPLAVFPDGRDGSYYLRAAMDSDANAGSIRFAGAVPAGAMVTATEVLPEGILSGSAQSVAEAIADYKGTSPAIALVFSCAARKWVLGTRAEQEIGLLSDAFAEGGSAGVPVAGFYCYGEIAPFAGGKRSQFHNESCVTVLIGT